MASQFFITILMVFLIGLMTCVYLSVFGLYLLDKRRKSSKSEKLSVVVPKNTRTPPQE